MILNVTGVNMCGCVPSDGKANLRYLGLKNSNFSRLAGAAPQAGVAMRLKAGAARLFTVVHDSATAFRITTLLLRKRSRSQGVVLVGIVLLLLLLLLSVHINTAVHSVFDVSL